MKVIRLADGIYTLDQSSYITKMVEKFQMSDCKIDKPMEVEIKLKKEVNAICEHDYRS